jgi:hypothetical protein
MGIPDGRAAAMLHRHLLRRKRLRALTRAAPRLYA